MTDLVSVIVPVRNEETNIPILTEEICRTLDGLGRPYEFIVIDDGSDDATFQAIRKECARSERIRGIRLRRHFGQTMAMKAGFDNARGDVLITLDGDLQHDPGYIGELLELIGQGHDLVCSYRVGRSDPLLRRIPSKVANWLARRLSSMKIRDFGSTYRAYRREVIREMPVYGDMHRFIPVFIGMITARITEIPIKLRPRKYGTSKYGLGRVFRVVSDLVVLLFFSKFLNRPIHIFGYLSFLLGAPGMVLLTGLAIRKIAFGIPIMQYGPLFVLGTLLCLVAAQLFTTGVVCEYLVRVLYNPGGAAPYSVAERTTDATQ